MNPWDVATWLAAIALAASAVVIFVFFLRDARSIFQREMHDHVEEDSAPGGSSIPGASEASDSTVDGAASTLPSTPPSTPPKDLSR